MDEFILTFADGRRSKIWLLGERYRVPRDILNSFFKSTINFDEPDSYVNVLTLVGQADALW